MNNGNNYVTSAVALSVTEAAVLPYNKDRTALILSNQSAVNIHVYTDTAANYIVIPALTNTMMFEGVPVNALYAVAASGTANLAVWEA